MAAPVYIFPITSSLQVNLPGQSLSAVSIGINGTYFGPNGATITYQYLDVSGNSLYSGNVTFTYNQFGAAGASFLTITAAATALMVAALSSVYT